jgi:hypothetical protein
MISPAGNSASVNAAYTHKKGESNLRALIALETAVGREAPLLSPLLVIATYIYTYVSIKSTNTHE